MSNLIDITNRKYNKLLVVERVENTPNGKTQWKCLCDCGKYTIVRGSNLKSGQVRSCGCTRKKSVNKTHAMSKSSLYRTWNNMKNRCANKKCKSYKDYGARGINVCEEWANSFESFMEWALDNGYEEGLTIDRKCVDLGYFPDNCQWITKGEQAKNRRFNLSIEFNGETKTLQEWCIDLNLNYKRIHNRIHKLGWSFEKAISTPVSTTKRNKKAREIYGNNRN